VAVLASPLPSSRDVSLRSGGDRRPPVALATATAGHEPAGGDTSWSLAWSPWLVAITSSRARTSEYRTEPTTQAPNLIRPRSSVAQVPAARLEDELDVIVEPHKHVRCWRPRRDENAPSAAPMGRQVRLPPTESRVLQSRSLSRLRRRSPPKRERTTMQRRCRAR
jgi:hypothetical protein